MCVCLIMLTSVDICPVYSLHTSVNHLFMLSHTRRKGRSRKGGDWDRDWQNPPECLKRKQKIQVLFNFMHHSIKDSFSVIINEDILALEGLLSHF